MKCPKELKTTNYETSIYDFNKIDFRKKEAKKFKNLLKGRAEKLPDLECVVFTIRHCDLMALIDIDKIILN